MGLRAVEVYVDLLGLSPGHAVVKLTLVPDSNELGDGVKPYVCSVDYLPELFEFIIEVFRRGFVNQGKAGKVYLVV